MYFMFLYSSSYQVFFKHTDTFASFSKSKIKGLLLPYIIANFAFLILDYFRKGIIIRIFDSLVGLQIATLVETLWFVISLFYVSIVYKSIDCLVRNRINIESIISVVFLGMACFFPFVQIFTPSLIAMVLFHLGRIAAERNCVNKLQKYPLQAKLLLLLLIVPILIILCHFNQVNVSVGQIGNPLLFLLGSTLGAILTLTLSSFLLRVKVLGVIIEYIGKRTMWVLIFHMSIIQLVFLARESLAFQMGVIDSVSIIPINIITYLLAVFVPCVICEIWRFLKDKVFLDPKGLKSI